ncbi:hypothetical protein Pmani_022234 [Petrolisthes manimaculis]|uniref:Ig-like domain-containing protein n=1 Tax=Petrolisthes manimaculis TaxID=1843537 RepID=A0AAE1PDC2_9EUCA|nr:hypothetical protein Pmani_022234 [Petrolisthes manimaculis]
MYPAVGHVSYCCVVTESLRPSLTSTVPSAVIVNGPAIHVHRGSLINLTCVVEHTPERPIFIVWYHYNQVMDYEEAGGQVVVSQPGVSTVSQLLVPAARPSHSGKYTCRPSTGEDASVILHVLDGENPAAMQTNGGMRVMVTPCSISSTLPSPHHALTLLLLLVHLASDLRDLET